MVSGAQSNDLLTPGAVIELTVGDLTHGGAAVARHGEFVVFVAGAAPGERVRARVTERRRTFARAVVEEVLDASPDRVAPPCPYFGPCGGCQWQFLAYPAQLAAKQRILRDQLRRALRLDERALARILRAPIGMRDPWAYRNVVNVTPDADGKPAFRHLHSHTPVAVTHCPISLPAISAALAKLTESRIEAETTIRVGNDGDVAVYSDEAPHAVTLSLLGQEFRVGGDSFFQVNTKPEQRRDLTGLSPSIGQAPHSMADILARCVLDALALTGRETIVDAYAGVGTFAILAARRAHRVIAVEEMDAAATDARHNARIAGRDNVLVHARKAERFLPTLDRQVDAVILDPPRAGCAPPVLDALLRLRPGRIVYVSCDPATLARDLAVLAGGYALASVQLLDLFPQTFHLEAVAVLERREEAA